MTGRFEINLDNSRSTVTGDAGRFLQLSRGIPSNNLLSMIPQTLILIFRNAIKQLDAGEAPLLYEDLFPMEEKSEIYNRLFDILSISKQGLDNAYLIEWQEKSSTPTDRPPRLQASPTPQETFRGQNSRNR